MEPLSLEEWLDGLDCCGMYSALVNQVRLSFQSPPFLLLQLL